MVLSKNTCFYMSFFSWVKKDKKILLSLFKDKGMCSAIERHVLCYRLQLHETTVLQCLPMVRRPGRGKSDGALCTAPPPPTRFMLSPSDGVCNITSLSEVILIHKIEKMKRSTVKAMWPGLNYYIFSIQL